MRLMTKQCHIDAASYDNPRLFSIQCTQVENHATSARNITKKLPDALQLCVLLSYKISHHDCKWEAAFVTSYFSLYQIDFMNHKHTYHVYPPPPPPPGWCIYLCSSSPKRIDILSYMGLLTDIAGFACAGNVGDVFPARPQRKPLVRDLSIHHGTYLTHMPWCMSGH